MSASVAWSRATWASALLTLAAFAAVVQREHQLAGLFDELAFLDVDLADGAGGLRVQVDAAERGDGAVGLQDHRHVLTLHADRVDHAWTVGGGAAFATLPS